MRVAMFNHSANDRGCCDRRFVLIITLRMMYIYHAGMLEAMESNRARQNSGLIPIRKNIQSLVTLACHYVPISIKRADGANCSLKSGNKFGGKYNFKAKRPNDSSSEHNNTLQLGLGFSLSRMRNRLPSIGANSLSKRVQCGAEDHPQ